MVGVVWSRAALRLFSPADDVCVGCADDWFRRTQLVVAVAGIALVLVSIAYLVHTAFRGRTWRRRRAVGAALTVAVLAWAGLVLIVAWS